MRQRDVRVRRHARNISISGVWPIAVKTAVVRTMRSIIRSHSPEQPEIYSRPLQKYSGSTLLHLELFTIQSDRTWILRTSVHNVSDAFPGFQSCDSP